MQFFQHNIDDVNTNGLQEILPRRRHHEKNHETRYGIWFPVKAVGIQTGSSHASRCWTGRGDPVGSTGSQRLSGSGVPTIGGDEPGGEVSRVSHPSRGRRSTDRPGADVEPCGKPAREPYISLHEHAPPHAHLRVCTRTLCL